MVTQFWIGSTDLGFMLSQIGGWHVGCYNHREAAAAVDYAIERKLVTTRTHYAPAIPEGSEAFELTEAGVAECRRLWGDRLADQALETRKWYRDHTATKPAQNRNRIVQLAF